MSHIPTVRYSDTAAEKPLTSQEVAMLRKAAELAYGSNARAADKAERVVRAWLRTRVSPFVESVSWIQREHGTEFVRLPMPKDRRDSWYDQVLELVTAPGSPLELTREREGKHETFVYLRLVKVA